MKGAWPLAVVGSLGYITGQLPTAIYLGPYLPDVIGAIVCFFSLLLLLKFWQPSQTLGYGGVPVTAAQEVQDEGHKLTAGEVFQGWMPIIVLILIVVAWTGPWSKLPSISWFQAQVNAVSSISPGANISAVFEWTPFVGGSAILTSWIVIALLLRVNGAQLSKIWKTTWSMMWGAMLVGVFIFGLAYVFNFSGMAGSLAKAFAELGPFYIIVSPLLGFIGVALSAAIPRPMRCSANFKRWSVRSSACHRCCCRRSIPSVRKSASPWRRKPRASASRPASSCATRARSSDTILGGRFFLLAYLVLIGIACYLFFPQIMELPK